MTTIENTKGTQTIVFEQTTVARYVAVAETAGGFTIPSPDFPLSDRHIEGIEVSWRDRDSFSNLLSH
jgi:hypothetical protein